MDSDRRPGPTLAVVGLLLLLLAVVAALLPFWPCRRCEGSGQLHRFDGALVTPSANEHLRRHVKPKTQGVEPCPVCGGRARCTGWRNLLDLWR